MPPAPAAPDLDPIHAIAMVRDELDAPRNCIREAWPTALRIELVLREEDYVPTASATVRSIILAAEQLACEWLVSPPASEDAVLLGRQFILPFAVRLDYLGFAVQRRPSNNDAETEVKRMLALRESRLGYRAIQPQHKPVVRSVRIFRDLEVLVASDRIAVLEDPLEQATPCGRDILPWVAHSALRNSV